jgi:hypothetical protein
VEEVGGGRQRGLCFRRGRGRLRLDGGKVSRQWGLCFRRGGKRSRLDGGNVSRQCGGVASTIRRRLRIKKWEMTQLSRVLRMARQCNAL